MGTHTPSTTSTTHTESTAVEKNVGVINKFGRIISIFDFSEIIIKYYSIAKKILGAFVTKSIDKL